MIDWPQFLKNHAIFYIEAGKNVARGHINIQCPYCGPNDPSQHMGIRLSDGAWGCLRNADHRGKSPLRLIMTLTGCSKEDAAQLIEDDTISPVSDLQKRYNEMFCSFDDAKTTFQMPREFEIIREDNHTHHFWEYLVERGFYEDDIEAVIRRYDLRCSCRSRFEGRIIIPIYHTGCLIGWTARAISSRERLRYMSFPEGRQIKTVVYNSDGAAMPKGETGDLLVVCEGPFDAIKLDFYAPRGCAAVAMFGISETESQLSDIIRIASHYKRLLICLDSAAEVNAVRLERRLSCVRPRIASIRGFKDPGEMTPNAVISWWNRFL